MTTTTDTPKIYVACLAAYNNGKLHGRWIDVAGLDADGIYGEVQEMLEASPEPDAEEWAIHDYEGFAGLKLSEYESFETVAALADAIDEYGPAFAAWYDNETREPDEFDRFVEEYRGEYTSDEDYARHVVAELGWAGLEGGSEALNALESYLDWAAITREIFMGGCEWSADADGGGVYVFVAM